MAEASNRVGVWLQSRVLYLLGELVPELFGVHDEFSFHFYASSPGADAFGAVGFAQRGCIGGSQ